MLRGFRAPLLALHSDKSPIPPHPQQPGLLAVVSLIADALSVTFFVLYDGFTPQKGYEYTSIYDGFTPRRDNRFLLEGR